MGSSQMFTAGVRQVYYKIQVDMLGGKYE